MLPWKKKKNGEREIDESRSGWNKARIYGGKANEYWIKPNPITPVGLQTRSSRTERSPKMCKLRQRGEKGRMEVLGSRLDELDLVEGLGYFVVSNQIAACIRARYTGWPIWFWIDLLSWNLYFLEFYLLKFFCLNFCRILTDIVDQILQWLV